MSKAPKVKRIPESKKVSAPSVEINENVVRAQLIDMIEIQGQLNLMIDPDWMTSGHDWQRCIMVELCELMDHFGYKFWKKQETDLKQCQLEVLDIFHFWISHSLSKKMNVNFEIMIHYFSEKRPSTPRNFDNDLTRQRIDELVNKASNKFFAAHDMCKLIEMFIDFEDVFKMYFAKNTLNIFRQTHGYKNGSYLKIWNGKEDNVVLMEIIDQFGFNRKVVQSMLCAKYAEALSV